MTIKEVYNGVVIESNQIAAQSIQLEEFNAIANKVVKAFVNDRYKAYNTVQQVSDDLRTLKRSFRSFTNANTDGSYNNTGCNILEFNTGANFAIVPNIDNIESGVYYYFHVDGALTGKFKYTEYEKLDNGTFKLTGITAYSKPKVGTVLYAEPVVNLQSNRTEFGDAYNVFSPSNNYMHQIGCYITYKDSSLNRSKTYTAKKLNEDSRGAISDNSYLKPHYSRPYYTEESNNLVFTGVDNTNDDNLENNRLSLRVEVGDQSILAATTYLHMIHVDYIKRPEKITIFEKDIWETDEDTSQIMEFPDYLINHFVTSITTLLLEAHGQRSFDSHAQVNKIVGDIPETSSISGSDTHQNSINARQAAQSRGSNN